VHKVIKSFDNYNNINSIDQLKQTNIKNLNILLISTQYAYYGGAATLAYKLHKKLLENDFNSTILFLNSSNLKEVIYNPDKLNNVYSELLNENYDSDLKSFYSKFLEKNINTPNLIIGFNYIAPIIGKKLYPESKVFYYVTGCKYISKTDISASDYLADINKIPEDLDHTEIYCLGISDYLIPNSYLTKNIFLKMYPNMHHKMTDVYLLEEIFFDKKEKQDKIYDIAIISSRFDRDVKNIGFIKELFDNPELQKYSKICIGKNSDKFLVADKHFGLVKFHEVDNILSKTKLILITSKYESFSISLVQGINNNCIVLSNTNVGANIYLNNYYINDNFDSDIWINKIKNILENYDYHQELFKPVIKNINLKEIFAELKKKYIEANVLEKKNIIFVSVDKPFDGGSSTNIMNILKIYKNNNKIRPLGLFIINNFNGLDIKEFNNNDIYFLLFDKNIEINIKKLLLELEDKYGDIDLFFVKNYKACVCISKFVNINKIIFSPSGLRFISSLTDYYENINITQFANHNQIKYEFDETLDLFTFISKYDLMLEKYIFNKVKYIIPNSELTYSAIKNLYNLSYNLLKPINITYIDFEKNKIYQNETKKYDLAFISYSWNRRVKNYKFIKELLKCEEFDQYKIVIIGKNRDKDLKKKKNITFYDNLPNKEIKELLKNVKLFCINSLYDSSPNVIKESLQNGCKILLTKNIGNYNIFNEKYIVKKSYNLEEWKEKIINILNNYKYNENDLFNNTFRYDNVKQNLEDIILSICEINKNSEITNKDYVGIYKLNSQWDLEPYLIKLQEYKNDTVHYNNYIDLYTNPEIDSEIKNELIDIAKKTYNYDLFFNYFINKFDGKNTDKSHNYHYIIYTELNIQKLTNINLIYLYPYLKSNIYVWFINKAEDVNLFKNKKKYFFRGNSYNLFNEIAENNYTQLYCATSLFYSNDKQLNIGKIIKYNFDKLLVEEDNIDQFKDKFPNTPVVKFLKNPTSTYLFKNMERDIDFIFVSTELQPTKNRFLFVDFILYCESLKLKLTFVNVGKHDSYYEKIKELKYINYITYDKVVPDELINLYNRSKINLLFSGRDALPRVLLESICCGCYNIALDTLTDGKFLYREPFGKLLSYPTFEKLFDKKINSLSYKSNKIIFNDIINLINFEFDHKNISLEFRKYLDNYNEDNFSNNSFDIKSQL
jgi:hypothetical protein